MNASWLASAINITLNVMGQDSQHRAQRREGLTVYSHLNNHAPFFYLCTRTDGHDVADMLRGSVWSTRDPLNCHCDMTSIDQSHYSMFQLILTMCKQ